MEELIRMWERQREFNKNFHDSISMNLDDRQKWTKEMVLHLMSECDELLRETKWKIHRQEHKIINRSSIVEELTDIFKYWLTLAQLWEVSPDEFLQSFNDKSEVVEQRYKQEKVLKLISDDKVVALDIDGVLADYPGTFIKYIEQQTKIDLSKVEITEYNLFDILGDIIGYARLKNLKHQFRITGQKRTMGVIKGAAEFTQHLKQKGYTIVLLSARPYKQYPRIFSDTIYWLKNNSIKYDAIIWDENKEERIMNEFPNMLFMVEDHFGNAKKVADRGYKVYMMDATYNQEKSHANIKRIFNLNEVFNYEN